MINDKLVEHISKSCLIRDSYIQKINFIFLDRLAIQIVFNTSNGEIKTIQFNGVKEYLLFNDSIGKGEVLVSHYKLFKQGESYYFSIDPYTENNVIEPEDNDYVLFSNFELLPD